jgi:hypothetical protein
MSGMILVSGFRLMPAWTASELFDPRPRLDRCWSPSDWCSARISLEQLTARVSFARRKLRGVAARRGMLPGEIWFGPVAPVIEER